MKDGKVAPTDSRYRPDQRALEAGDIDGAGKQKLRLEEAQRKRRAARKAAKETWEPRWFEQRKSDLTGNLGWVYKGGYFEARESPATGFANCPRIFPDPEGETQAR